MKQKKEKNCKIKKKNFYVGESVIVCSQMIIDLIINSQISGFSASNRHNICFCKINSRVKKM